jgi:hypothetical protein
MARAGGVGGGGVTLWGGTRRLLQNRAAGLEGGGEEGGEGGGVANRKKDTASTAGIRLALREALNRHYLRARTPQVLRGTLWHRLRP